MDYSTIDLTFGSSPIAEIVLNRPEKRNALSETFWKEFPAALRVIDASPETRVLILRSEGAHFSSGMDLDFFQMIFARQSEEASRYREWLRRQILELQSTVNLLEDIRVPVISVIQGACIGGALDLICATNIRVASADAYFTIHEINIGMTADLGSLQRLPRLLPAGIVQEMAFTGLKLPAQKAAAHGFLSSVYPDHDTALTKAREIAENISQKSPLAIAGTKIALTHARDHSIPEGLQHIANWNAGMFISEDLTLAVDAQKNRTTPNYLNILPL